MLLSTSNIPVENLHSDLLNEKRVTLQVIRLDKIHPVVSGNKLFKLYYFLQHALNTSRKGILSFGGAYSNHLVATAYACRQAELSSVGIIRGEQPPVLSHTLYNCKEYGMNLVFISRNEYHQKEQPDFLTALNAEFRDYLIVPEGGYHPLGAKGAALIMDVIESDTTHICCAIGTATTISGLLMGAKNVQQVIGITVLKGLNDLHQRISFLTDGIVQPNQLQIFNDYHFGGYAKKKPELIAFMNEFYRQYAIPTDFVYTGKMMFAVIDKIAHDFFPKGSKIACIHTGGLQGNLSLSADTLVFD